MSITTTYKKFGLIDISTTWFNTKPELTADDLAAVHVFRQSETDVQIRGIQPIHKAVFTTTVLDLTLSVDELWKNCAPKSCRYEIRKIRKMIDSNGNIETKKNVDLNRFLEVANNYIKQKNNYTTPLNIELLRHHIDGQNGELINIYFDGKLVGGNFYICDHPNRVRLLYSFNDRFSSTEIRKYTGALMRYLHWHAIQDVYKRRGIQWYDFGGVDLREDSPVYGISKFKMSFGGTLRKEYDLRVIKNPALARAYRVFRTSG